ncbi:MULTISPECIES: universal stress protein [unclassified Nocardioides]|uniref:universal stress protein n=1 Tax=unclassified Nocardioides TaxID=2615069 RepID=UPI0006FC803E|nr:MULTISPECIES: universal stress protein [unclassified Nocardioides]KRA32444.1 hypothetical protein ASD81_12820 [Nocardioides sp. Root614]KRA89097.1 hypothetical protein ASD84_13085 [Nocardioides sp. Root682]
MKTTIDPSSIVVATDGSDDAHRAVHWAAEQAYLERRPLAVVTAIGTPGVPAIAWAGMGAAYAYQPHELVEYGRVVADQALALVRRLRPGLRAEATVLTGDPRQALVDLSSNVHLLVLGSRGRGAFRSKVLGSVSAAVSRDASCPVIVCRPVSSDRTPDQGVLVGADGTPESLPVIEFAFHQASLLGLPLTVVHCVGPEIGVAAGVVGESSPARSWEEHRLLLSESVAGMSTKFPEVDVDLRLASGIAEVYLARNTGAWNLVVVGRHPVDTVFQFLTGAVATAVVERAHTTVAVVPQSEPRPES